MTSVGLKQFHFLVPTSSAKVAPPVTHCRVKRRAEELKYAGDNSTVCKHTLANKTPTLHKKKKRSNDTLGGDNSMKMVKQITIIKNVNTKKQSNDNKKY